MAPKRKQISNQPSAAKGVASFDAKIVENKAEGRIGIIQLSDLQFGKKHIFNDPKDLADRLVSDILQMSEDHKFKPYFLVLSGDIAEEAKEDEYKQAEELVKLLKDALSIDVKQIMCVPGNHDIDWVRCINSQELNKFQPYNEFLKNIGCDDQQTKNSLYSFISHPKLKINFVLLNSCERYNHQRENHFPYICARKLKATLKSTEEKECLWIGITHHPLNISPLDLHEVIEDLEKKNSGKISVALANHSNALENAQEVKDIIKSYEFDVILTGHTHKVSFDASISSNTHNVILAGSGSVAVDNSQLDNGVLNQYSIHVLDFAKSIFERHSRVLIKGSSKHGCWKCITDPSMDDNPAKLNLDFLKETQFVRQTEEEDLGAVVEERSVPEEISEVSQTSLASDEFADELAILNLLGGWNE